MSFVNYFGDASNLFSKGYEEKIAREIIKGNNVTNVYNYDERLLQKDIINYSSLCHDIVVIGSSRIMLLNSSYFKGKTFFNYGVSGASIEDLFSIVQMLEQKKCLPKKIIIGLDPWTLNANNGQTRWKKLESEYEEFYNKMTRNYTKQKDNLFENVIKIIKENMYYTELFSPTYFKSSLSILMSENTKPFVAKEKVNNTFTKISDGSISYDLKYRSASNDEIEKRINAYLSGEIYGIENFDKLDTTIKTKLDFLTNYLLKKNINVEFFLAPYHPKVYSYIAKKEKYHQVIESEKYFIYLGVKYKIKITGSFNPNVLNMDSSYFYDGMHCNEKGMEKILSSEKK
jgi:hypothetical protein